MGARPFRFDSFDRATSLPYFGKIDLRRRQLRPAVHR
jgi:hypothetical protein